MRIVIVGAGLTGTQLARYLIQEKHDVFLIEANEERARYASNRLDCIVLHDGGNNLESLIEAGIDKADALVCVTESDELNMIICGLAASRCPDLVKIARVRNDEYARLNHAGEQGAHDSRVLGIDYFIHPDVEAAQAVLNALTHQAMGNILAFPGTPYELGSINVAEGSAFDGLSLMDFRSVVKEESLIILVERGEESFLPRGSTKLIRDDRVHIMAREENMDSIFRLAGRTDTPLRKIGIVGGGRVGTLIAAGLLDHETRAEDRGGEHKKGIVSLFKSFIPKNSRRVIIIEQNYEVCKELAARFPEALVLNEDISDESFITEEQMDDLDLIITATANQELNMVAAMYLKSRGVRRAAALVSSSGYETIARQLGVDVVVPVKSVVVDSILSHLMGRRIRGIHRLGDGGIRIIEFEIGKDSPAVDRAITEFKLSAGGLVMLAGRGETSFIPQGDYVFKSGDKLILIARDGSDAELERFFGKPE